MRLQPQEFRVFLFIFIFDIFDISLKQTAALYSDLPVITKGGSQFRLKSLFFFSPPRPERDVQIAILNIF